jgi:hypothetical protein
MLQHLMVLTERGYLKLLAYVKDRVKPGASGLPPLTRESLTAMHLNTSGLMSIAELNCSQ